MVEFNLYILTILTLFVSQATQINGQSVLTLDDFIALALNDDSDPIRIIQTQKSINQLELSLARTSFSPSVSMSLSGPTYSKNITPVTQPDGSVCYRRVNNINESLSFSLSIPINPTGGSLSIQTSVSAYTHFTDETTSKSISMNYCRLTLSQPLNFFSDNKWDKKLVNLSFQKKSIENSDSFSDEIVTCIRTFFNLILCQYRDSLLKSELNVYTTLSNRIANQLRMGRALETDLEEAILKCREIESQITDNEINWFCQREFAQLKYNILLDANVTYSCPAFPSLIFNEDSLATLALAKVDAQYAYSLERQRKNIEKVRRSQLGSPSFSANVGLSSSASHMADIGKHIGQDYGAGINLSISITGISSNKKQLKKTTLECESLVMSHKSKRKQMVLDVKENCQKFRALMHKYQNCCLKEQVLKKKRECIVDKFLLQHLLLSDVEQALAQIFQTKVSQLETILDAYVLKTNIEKNTSIQPL